MERQMKEPKEWGEGGIYAIVFWLALAAGIALLTNVALVYRDAGKQETIDRLKTEIEEQKEILQNRGALEICQNELANRDREIQRLRLIVERGE